MEFSEQDCSDRRAANQRWVRRFHPNDMAERRLLCFPHAGGSSSYFFPVSKVLQNDFDVCALQYPGRQDRRRDPLLPSISALANGAAQALLPWCDRPLIFFGHSLGATIAYEVAQRLREFDTLPQRIFLSGQAAPGQFEAGEQMHLWPDSQLLDALRNLHGTDARLLADEDSVRTVLPALRSDLCAAETYVHNATYAPLPVPITVLNGANDPRVTRADVDAWADHTECGLTQHWFTGGHFYLNEHQYEILRLLRTSP